MALIPVIINTLKHYMAWHKRNNCPEGSDNCAEHKRGFAAFRDANHTNSIRKHSWLCLQPLYSVFKVFKWNFLKECWQWI